MIVKKLCFCYNRRKTILVLVFCPFLLIFQMIFLFFLLPSKVTDDVTVQISSEPNQKTDEFHLIKQFLQKTTEYKFPIVVVNKEILKNLSTLDVKTTSICPQFCTNRIVTFVIFYELFESNVKSYFGDLSKIEGLKYVTINDVGSSSDLPVHYVIGCNKGNGFFIHLVVFHHKKGNFWWNGQMTMTETLRQIFVGIKLDDFAFGQFQGVYDKFTIRPIQIEGFNIYVPVDITSFLQQIQTSRFIPCNRKRASIFRETYEKHDIAESEEKKTFKETALEVLFRTKTVLDTIGIPFWLSSGTCLGYFRQCDIITYSRDVDIGIWITDYDTIIIDSLVAGGFKMKHKLGKVEDSLELSFIVSGIKLDIFFFYKDRDYVWNGGLQTKSGKKFKYIFPKFHLCWTEFLDLKVRIPCETQSYIEANYGSDWFKPVINWDWKSSPSNVHENGQWPKNEWPQVIQQFDVD